MSRLHRSASAQMSRPAITIRSGGGWTFGSPSVLMMFHRRPGDLDKELAEMDECMPHYYKVTGGHGQGAETIMRAEAAFLQGRFVDAQIELEHAYAQIANNGQVSMALCCDFLAWRLAAQADFSPRFDFSQRRSSLLQQHNTEWLHMLDAACAYYYALLGMPGKTPPVFREHRLSSINFLAPGKPMMELIENQVCLAQGSYAQVIGRSEGQLAACRRQHYALVALHIRLQAASAYEMLGKHKEARALLGQALADAAKDGLVMPFVENYRYLKPLLAEAIHSDLIHRITTLGAAAEDRRSRSSCPALPGLTPREQEIASLAALRLSNREIAEKLHLSEGSVKQYISQIYSKLAITGDTRLKRQRLAELINT